MVFFYLPESYGLTEMYSSSIFHFTECDIY